MFPDDAPTVGLGATKNVPHNATKLDMLLEGSRINEKNLVGIVELLGSILVKIRGSAVPLNPTERVELSVAGTLGNLEESVLNSHEHITLIGRLVRELDETV